MSRLILSCAATLLLGPLATLAAADELLRVDFEDGTSHGWTANGVVTLYTESGNPGTCLALPYSDFFGVSLSAREPDSRMLGDLTLVGSMRLSFDVRMFNAHTYDGTPLDLSQWPMVFELVHRNAEGDPIPEVTVFFTGRAWPSTEDGWKTVSFDLPDPSSLTLPAGWHGTGDWDPQTGEPRLPAGVTYRDVLSAVDEVRVTTFVPGYFYTANFWEVGFDNIVVESTATPCLADFNHDTTVNSQDFFDFLGAFFASDPRADFNHDASVNSQDFFDFLAAFFPGC